MKHLIIYADNTLCLDGHLSGRDPDLLKKLGIPERRPVPGSKEAETPVKRRVGSVLVTIWNQPQREEYTR